jgi:antitoxin ChpS
MLTTSFRRVGGSVMLTIPPAFLESLAIKEGSQAEIDIIDGRLVIEPQKRRYTLEQLLALCDANTELNQEDQAWLDAPAIGNELL